jgi:hypothetical protein
MSCGNDMMSEGKIIRAGLAEINASENEKAFRSRFPRNYRVAIENLMLFFN